MMTEAEYDLLRLKSEQILNTLNLRTKIEKLGEAIRQKDARIAELEGLLDQARAQIAELEAALALASSC